MIELLQPYLISFALGLLIGIERERAHPAGIQAMGVRTFILFALLGTFAAELRGDFFSITISLFVFGAILFSYFRTSAKTTQKVGITTELSGAVVYCLGYLAARESLLAMVIAVAVLLILFSRKSLHAFARESLQPKEIRATITILVIALIVLSFLPNRTVDPWDIFNPRRFGVIVLLLSAMQFAGYVALRLFNRQLGMVLLGFFGGLASSTAVFATLPRYSRRHPTMTWPLVVAAIFAQIGTLVELIAVLLFIAPNLVISVIWPVFGIVAVGLVLSLLVIEDKQNVDVIEMPKNPLDIRAVLRLSIFIGGMIFLVSLAKRFLPEISVPFINFIGGLFELHSVSIANATLFKGGKIALHDAAINQYLAILASFITKFVLLATLARNRFALYTSIFLFLMLLAGAGSTALFYWIT